MRQNELEVGQEYDVEYFGFYRALLLEKRNTNSVVRMLAGPNTGNVLTVRNRQIHLRREAVATS